MSSPPPFFLKRIVSAIFDWSICWIYICYCFHWIWELFFLKKNHDNLGLYFTNFFHIYSFYHTILKTGGFSFEDLGFFLPLEYQSHESVTQSDLNHYDLKRKRTCDVGWMGERILSRHTCFYFRSVLRENIWFWSNGWSSGHAAQFLLASYLLISFLDF